MHESFVIKRLNDNKQASSLFFCNSTSLYDAYTNAFVFVIVKVIEKALDV
jgi:hypothetical protein